MSGFGACSRWTEVEAAEDGRLGPREVERAQRHLAHCAKCRGDLARWEAHRVEARAFARAGVSELEHHRARAALLRASVRDTEAPHVGRRAAVLLGALALVAVVLARGTRGGEGGSLPARPSEARVDAVGDARWSRASTEAVETVLLTEGALRVAVPRQRVGHRFVVALPDGELEVRGTQFLVEARGGRTRRVSVFEGLVALRVADEAVQLIAAGGHWQAPERRPSVAPAPVAAPDAGAQLVVTPRASAERPVPRGGAEAPAFERFAAGVEAMGRGQFTAAAAAFERFERERPRDERADDAAWLRVVALRRGGDGPRALEAAARYLDTYPSGAHRGEAATLRARDAFLRGDCAQVAGLAAVAGSSAGAGELRRLRDRCAPEAGAP